MALNFLERRRQAREINREIKYKQGIARIKSFIRKCEEMQKRYWELGKRALRLNDEQLFRNLVRAYLQVGEYKARWERFLILLETLAVQRDQVRATTEFIKSIRALSDSILAGAKPEDLVKVQERLLEAETHHERLNAMLETAMGVATDAVFSSEELSEEKIKEIERLMAEEAGQEEGEAVDARISEAIKKIEEEMRKESK